MAELLIRVKDKINAVDYYKNFQCTKRGDVIVACPDGWNWGNDELSDPQYRIVKIPSLPLIDAQALTTPEQETDPVRPSRTLQRRGFKLNLDDPSLPQAFQDFIKDDSRKQQTINLSLTKQQVLAIKVKKAAIADASNQVGLE